MLIGLKHHPTLMIQYCWQCWRRLNTMLGINVGLCSGMPEVADGKG
jgi:ABC-type Fe2+-enterobactin transport system substrate-binding protein